MLTARTFARRLIPSVSEFEHVNRKCYNFGLDKTAEFRNVNTTQIKRDNNYKKKTQKKNSTHTDLWYHLACGYLV